MRKGLIFALLCIVTSISSAQDNPKKLSFTFVDLDLVDALNEIESKSDYNFFYLNSWIQDIIVSGEFKELEIDEILNVLFKNTVLNYYVKNGNDIFLLRSSMIYDTLPQNYFSVEEVKSFESEDQDEDVKNTTPLLVNSNITSSKRRLKTIRIGRENIGNRKKYAILTGKATDINTGEPIPNLAVIVKDLRIGATTDDTGTYSLKLPLGEHIVETSGLGMEKTSIKAIIYNDGTYDMKLNESFEVLDEVILEGDRDRNVKEALTGVTVIETAEIKNIPLVLGEQDILKVAISLPGISSAGEGSSGYNVRGGRTDQNLILLDEGVIYNPSHFFGIFSALNPFSTSSAEIFKGNIPAQYGGRLSSVFDITTKDANNEKFSGEASIGPVTSNVVLEVPLMKQKSSLLIGGRATYSDWILNSLEDEQLSNSTASFYDLIAKYNYDINENNEVEATGYYSRDAFSITSDSIFDYSNRMFSLKWNHKFNDKNTGSLVLTNSEYQFGINYDGDSNDDFDLGYDNTETEIKVKLKYLPSNKHRFDYGITSKLYNVNPGSLNPLNEDSSVASIEIQGERALESAVYLSDRYNVSDKFLLDVGLRYSFFMAMGAGIQRIYQENAPRNNSTLIETVEYDTNEIIKTYGGLEARLSARYFLKPDFSVKASYNSGYQYIHTLSNNTTVSPTDTWKLSDINIRPQQAQQYSLGFYKNFNGNVYELSLEGYYKDQKNILDYKVGAQLLLNEQIESEVLQGEGKAYGIEFLLKKNKGKLNGWLGYSYSRSFVRLDSEFSEERVNSGDFFPSNYDKPHDISMVANYKITKRFSFSTNFVYQTGRPVTFPIGSFTFNNSEFVYYSDRNKFRIPDYYRLDLSFNMEGNHKIKKFAHSFWSFSVYNVLGRNNPYSVFFVTQDGEVKAFQSSIFAIPVPTITYNFKF